MQVNEIKHQAKIAEWKQRIMECRTSGMSVVEWCRAEGVNRTTYYRWEQEIFGRATGIKVAEESSDSLKPMSPELAEIAIAISTEAEEQSGAQDRKMMFNPAAMIWIGKMEIGISNSATTKLIRQLKELLRDVE